MQRSTRSQRSLLASEPSSTRLRSQETSILVATSRPPSSSCSSRARAAFSRSATFCRLLERWNSIAVRCCTVRSSSRLRWPRSCASCARRRMSRPSRAPIRTTSTSERKLAAPSSTREVRRFLSEARARRGEPGGFLVPQLAELEPQVGHRALADVGVEQLDRGVPVDLAVQAQGRLHLADLLAGRLAEGIGLERHPRGDPRRAGSRRGCSAGDRARGPRGRSRAGSACLR